jgi:hypothetical protein
MDFWASSADDQSALIPFPEKTCTFLEEEIMKGKKAGRVNFKVTPVNWV